MKIKRTWFKEMQIHQDNDLCQSKYKAHLGNQGTLLNCVISLDFINTMEIGRTILKNLSLSSYCIFFFFFRYVKKQQQLLKK